MTTERDMLSLLKRRFRQCSPSGYPRYVYAEHVSYFGNTSEADAIALDGQSVPQEELLEAGLLTSGPGGSRVHVKPHVHGCEVKVSRADWLRELRTEGSKSYAWRQWCSYWWIVVPTADIIKEHELPKEWGLLVGTRALRVRSRPKLMLRPELPSHVYMSVARHALKTAQKYV